MFREEYEEFLKYITTEVFENIMVWVLTTWGRRLDVIPTQNQISSILHKRKIRVGAKHQRERVFRTLVSLKFWTVSKYLYLHAQENIPFCSIHTTYLNSQFSFTESIHTKCARSQSSKTLIVSPWNNKQGKHTFNYRGVKAWNKLASDVCSKYELMNIYKFKNVVTHQACV